MKKIVDVVKTNALLFFAVSSLFSVMCVLYIVIKNNLYAHTMSFLIVVYYFYKVIYYRMFGVLDD